MTPLDLAIEHDCRSVEQGLSRREDMVQNASIALPVEDKTPTKAVQALLEAKNSDNVFGEVVEVLKRNEYTTVKGFVRLGGNIMTTDEYCNGTILHEMVELGYVSLLEYFKSEASKVDQLS